MQLVPVMKRILKPGEGGIHKAKINDAQASEVEFPGQRTPRSIGRLS